MLCRPMTAAGVALPFGIYLVVWAFCKLAVAGAGTDAKSVGPTGSPGEQHVADAASIGAPADMAVQNEIPPVRRWVALLCTGVPLLCAGAGLFLYDKAITGNGWLT